MDVSDEKETDKMSEGLFKAKQKASGQSLWFIRVNCIQVKLQRSSIVELETGQDGPGPLVHFALS